MSTKEAMDMSGSRRRASAPKAGSVWESRMKVDEVKGGIKVFNATHENSEQITQNNCISTIGTVSNTEIQMDKKENEVTPPKQSPHGASGKRKTWKSEGSPLEIARKISELSKNLDEQCKEFSVSASDGIFKKSPVSIKKTRSVSSSDGNGKNGVGLRKVKSGFSEVVNDGKSEGDSDEKNIKNEKKSVLDGPNKDLEGSNGGMKKSRSDEEFGVSEEKGITSDVGQIKIDNPSDSDSEFVDGEVVDDDDDKEIEVEKKSTEKITVQEQKQKRIVIEEKKLLHSNNKAVPLSPIVKNQSPPAVNHARFHPSPTVSKPNNNFHGIPRSNSKLQSLVDLVMWRDASKSAFVFGIGTFVIISSSYTKDLNISFISVVSYLGLLYLVAIFLFRSLISRASMDNADQDYVVGEQEAIWVVKLFLPFVNEFLLKLRALFSGDPATTMKLAVLLFILARCGCSITIWKMAKLGFIGVFTVPKICSTYSAHLTAYGTFWIRRFGDAWESCSHKKAVGFVIFTLVWNLSSVVTRIWAVFMLFAVFKYYQQSLIKEELVSEEDTGGENSYWPKHRRTKT